MLILLIVSVYESVEAPFVPTISTPLLASAFQPTVTLLLQSQHSNNIYEIESLLIHQNAMIGLMV
jgi:hypothetical protein